MNEGGFIKAVHRRLPKQIKRWKVKDDYEGGVPDVFYFGPAGRLLQVEYKFIPALPVRATTRVRPNPPYKGLQKLWFADMQERGFPVASIWGFDEGKRGVWIEDGRDLDGIQKHEFVQRSVSMDELVSRVTNLLV